VGTIRRVDVIVTRAADDRRLAELTAFAGER